MIQKILIVVALVGLMFAAYRIGYGAAERHADRVRYAELMAITSHLYLAAEQGQNQRLRESLGQEVLVATLWYENRVPDSERSRLSPDYSTAKQICAKVVSLMGTNGWRRGKDGLWLADTNR